MDTMSSRERFQAIMNFKPFDRLPVVEWAEWWDETIERWHGESLPKNIRDRYEICSHFGLDIYKQDWVEVRKVGCAEPPFHGAPIISTIDDYEKIKEHLFPLPAIDAECWNNWAQQQESGEIVIWFTVEGFFWFPRTLLGIEPHFFAFYEKPDLIHRINSDLTEWILKVIDEIFSICKPDFMTFAEDMSYNNGPMLSKELFDEFMKPYYNKVIPMLKNNNTIPIIDSDGDVTLPASWFEEVGLEGILPLERQAGVDISELRNNHPQMKFIGHFDKMTMTKGEAVMRKEFERLLPVASKGGYIIGCDHQTPPGVSYKDYELFISLFREYAKEAGRLSQEILNSG